MRQMISGFVAALAVVAAGTAPAMACGFGPCEQTYVPIHTPAYGCASTCNTGWAYERLAEPATQYYFVNQGPTYTGPGAFAPVPTYHEDALPGWNAYAKPYYYGYHGGHYASQYGYRAGLEEAAVTSYRWHRHHPWHARHHGTRYMPYHSYYHGHPVLRRYY